MLVSLSMEEKCPNMEWWKAQQICLSADLVEAAKKQLQFLATVDGTGHLYDGPAVERAIYRYKFCWLPLLAKHIECPVLEGPLVVPLDCEWIWHCHRLNPVQYKRDCEEIYGRILDNLNVMSTVEGTSSKQTELIWNQIYVRDPYYIDLSSNVHLPVSTVGPDAKVQRNIDYDLIEAVKRQSSFFSKVSKRINCDNSLIEEAVDRYKGFLHLIKKLGKRRAKYSCVPTHDIDLIWHSHQLNPIAYSKDLNAIFGGILDHNDRDSFGSSGPKKLLHGYLWTKELWESTYDCMYDMEEEIPKGNWVLIRARSESTMVRKELAKKTNLHETEDNAICWYNCWPVEIEDTAICWYNCWPVESVDQFERYSPTV